MPSIKEYITRPTFRELNEPHIFQYRYIKHKLGYPYIFKFIINTTQRRDLLSPINVIVCMKWRNYKVVDLIAFDDDHGYCLLGVTKISKDSSMNNLRDRARKFAQIYSDEIFNVFNDKHDHYFKSRPLNKDYFKFKKEFKKIYRDVIPVASNLQLDLNNMSGGDDEV